ncbi:MAG: GGDEF domain-containing protein [Acidimicrobiia bacterium]|nr:GGDEF domain-containing protein [Acidimicrobiia bacterium]
MDERTGTEPSQHLVPGTEGSVSDDPRDARLDREVLASLVDQHTDAVVVVDDHGTVVYANDSIALLGWRPEDMVGTAAFDYVHPDDLGRAAASTAAASADARPYPGLIRLRGASGDYQHVEVQPGSATSVDGASYLVFNVRDNQVNEAHWVTLAAVVAGEPTAESLQRLASGLSTDVDGPMAIAFDHGDSRQVVGTLPSVLALGDGADTDEASTDPFDRAMATSDVVVASTADLGPVAAAAARTLGLDRVVLVPVSDPATDRPALIVQWPPDENMAEVLREALTRRPAQLVRLILQRRADQARLEHMALHDDLTRLANRAQLFVAMERSAAGRAPAALAYLDLDGFKAVNDRFGHLAGDRVLQAVAERLTDVARGSDLVARLGGDEFAVLAAGVADVETADALGKRIADAVVVTLDDTGAVMETASAGTADDGNERVAPTTTVAASVGVAPLLPGDDLDAVVHAADEALYGAKRAGKGTWQLAPWR